jgi:hypothetical protein
LVGVTGGFSRLLAGEVHEAAQHRQRFDVVLEGQVGHTGLGGVGDGAAQFFGGHVFVGHGLHDFGPVTNM